jgi:arylsulfatase
MKELNAAAPDKPFFLYYVPGGTHAPHSRRRSGSKSSRASSTWAGTTCASRSSPTRSARRDPGEYPAHAVAGRPAEVGHAHADEKKLFARQAEVFAAYVAYTDHEMAE